MSIIVSLLDSCAMQVVIVVHRHIVRLDYWLLSFFGNLHALSGIMKTRHQGEGFQVRSITDSPVPVFDVHALFSNRN